MFGRGGLGDRCGCGDTKSDALRRYGETAKLLAHVFEEALVADRGAGQVDGKDVTIIDAFEAVGACARGLISQSQLDKIERAICPGEGACGGMYTANTMAAVGEAIGLSLPGSAAPPAVDRRRDAYSVQAGAAVVELIRQGITTRNILTKRAFENAITTVMARGGSTNAVLHLLAIAHEADVDLTLNDFHRVGSKVPLLGDHNPFGRVVMSDMDRVGGLPV